MRVIAAAQVRVTLTFIPDLIKYPLHPISRKAYHYGPNLLIACSAATSVFRPPQSIGAPGREKHIHIPLGLDVRPRKECGRYNGKTRQAIFLEYADPDGVPAQALIYDEPIYARVRSEGATLTVDGKRTTPEKPIEPIRIMNTDWDPNGKSGIEQHRDFPLRFYRIENFRRFPHGPADRLTFEVATNLKPGDEFGLMLPQDRPLELGYDADLAAIGFHKDGNGHNCVTDFGIRYSIPLRCPSPEEWAGSPLPMPLDLIQALRDTPSHSWRDEVMSFVGQRLLGIELGPVRGSNDPPEPTAVIKHREPKRCLDTPQPCYDGPRSAMKRHGRYLIFMIDRPQGTVCLVDSKWRDKEVAMHLFASLEHAEAYCRGERNVPRLGRKTHDPARGDRQAWDAPGVVETWIDNCLARAAAAEHEAPPARAELIIREQAPVFAL
ncbi:MAG: hypothetical protein U0136_11330 [Bdellovibrionota bacterium]